jgi:hypothetical protein
MRVVGLALPILVLALTGRAHAGPLPGALPRGDGIPHPICIDTDKGGGNAEVLSYPDGSAVLSLSIADAGGATLLYGGVAQNGFAFGTSAVAEGGINGVAVLIRNDGTVCFHLFAGTAQTGTICGTWTRGSCDPRTVPPRWPIDFGQ